MSQDDNSTAIIDLTDVTTLQATLCRAFLEKPVKLHPRISGSENRHATIHITEGRHLFVKIYSSLEKFHSEGSALAALSQHCDFVISASDEGVTDGIPWRAFPWVDLEAFRVDIHTAGMWGEILGRIHSAPPPSELPRSGYAIERLKKRLEMLQAFPEIYDRAQSLWCVVGPHLSEEVRAHTTVPVLLQNDFGIRNTFVRRDNRHIVLLDFERAGVGDSHWELGKCWDRELRDNPDVRSAFLRGYWKQRGIADESWPHLPTLWVTRFVATLAIFPYAARVGDHAFFEHGLFKLSILEQEASDWS